MSLSFFEKEESPTSGALLFLDEYLETNPKPKVLEHPVNEITLVKSKKGYMVKTDSFMVFIWKKSALATMLVEALERWCSTAPNEGYKLVVVIDTKHKDKYRIAADKSIQVSWFTSGNGYTTSELDASCQEENRNPFL